MWCSLNKPFIFLSFFLSFDSFQMYLRKLLKLFKLNAAFKSSIFMIIWCASNISANIWVLCVLNAFLALQIRPEAMRVGWYWAKLIKTASLGWFYHTVPTKMLHPFGYSPDCPTQQKLSSKRLEWRIYAIIFMKHTRTFTICFQIY